MEWEVFYIIDFFQHGTRSSALPKLHLLNTNILVSGQKQATGRVLYKGVPKSL